MNDEPKDPQPPSFAYVPHGEYPDALIPFGTFIRTAPREPSRHEPTHLPKCSRCYTTMMLCRTDSWPIYRCPKCGAEAAT